jgi:hypothetical protein
VAPGTQVDTPLSSPHPATVMSKKESRIVGFMWRLP